jgi:hypothetical protein
VGSNPTPSATSVSRLAVATGEDRNYAAPDRAREVTPMLLDVEVTVIEIDGDGDGTVDEELVIVEDVE